MTLSRHFLNDPFFQLFDDPWARPSRSHYVQPRTAIDMTPFFGYHPAHERSQWGNAVDASFQPSNVLRPNLDITEEGDIYVVEAHLPGVKKENLNVHIGDNGRSVTIEGKTFLRKRSGEPTSAKGDAQGQQSAEGTSGQQQPDSATAAKQDNKENAVSTNNNVDEFSSNFSRTIWLPRAVDDSKVSAKLVDGVLTLTIPKAVDKERVKINVD